MKKLLCIFLSLAMLFLLAACSQEESESPSKDKDTHTTTTGTAKRLTRVNISYSGSYNSSGYLDYIYDANGLERIDCYVEGEWYNTSLYHGSIDQWEGTGYLDTDGKMHKDIDYYYDENGNLIRFYNDAVYIDRRYNWEGKLEAQTSYNYQCGGLDIEHILYTYNDEGLLTKTETYSFTVCSDFDEDADPNNSMRSSSDTYTYEFYESGEVKKETVTSNYGSVNIYEYDEHGNLIGSEDSSSNPPYFADYQYDERGNLIRKESGYGGSGYITYYQYDDENRLIEERTESDSIATYHYGQNGDLEEVITVYEGDEGSYTVTKTFEFETVNDSEVNVESLDKYIEYAVEFG